MKLKHLFLTFCFVVGIFSVAFAQQQHTALNVATTNPSEPMNFAGNEQARFVTNIANTATDGSGMFIDSIQLQIPEGFDLVSLSLVKNGTTLASNSVSMQLNDTLKPAESYLLNYCIRVNCDAVPTNISNQFSVFFSNNLLINYTEHDTIKNLEKKTNDFKLEIPSLSLTIGKANSNVHNNIKEIVWQTPVTDTFTIKNAAGAGSISNLRVAMLLMQNVDAFSDVKFSVVGGQFRNAEVEDGKYYIDLSSSDFQQAGLGDTFDANQQLNVVVSFIPTKFYLQTQAKYLAQVKNGSDVCNEQINASAICDYQCNEPNIELIVDGTIIQQANYCGREFICDVVIKNATQNTELTNTLKNAYFYFSGEGNEYIVSSVQYNGMELVPDSKKNYLLPTADVDGDGTPDLIPQDSCIIRVRARFFRNVDKVMFWIILRGETVEERTISGSYSVASRLYVNSFSVTSPTDSKSGDVATYNVDVNLSTQNFFQQGRGFMDVDYIGIMYDSTIVKRYERTNSNIRSSDSIDIIASCYNPQLFNLVVKTNDCDEFYISDNKMGNSIVECPDSLQGNTCMSVHTIEVSSVVPQEINTCETFTVNAIGELAYLCNDTCPMPRRIIARVYDLEGNLQLESVSCSISVNGSSYTILPLSENVINNGIAWASNEMSFPCSGTLNHIPLQLTAEVFVKGNHSLPNRSDCNLRVEFAIEDDENIIHTANSKGSSLVVFDPEPTHNSSTLYPTRVSENITASITTTQSAETVINHPVRLLNVQLPAVEGFYYTTPSEVGNAFETNIENQVGFATRTTTQRAQFSINARALCVTGDSSYNGTLKGSYTYSDYYASCSENETFTHDLASVQTIYAPIIEMNSSVEQGVSRLTTWNVFVKNVGNADAPNVTLRIKPNENNVTGLQVARITVNDEDISFIEYPTNSDIIYVNIGKIIVNNNIPVRVTITMSGCTGVGTSYLDVTAIWTCEDIINTANIAEEFELRNCNNFFTQLELENMEAVLVAEASYPTDGTKFKLCQEIPIHLDIYNSGRANLSNVGLIMSEKSFPTGVNIANNLIYNEYNHKRININLDDVLANIKDKDTNAVYSKKLIGDESEAELPFRIDNNNIINSSFSLVVNCTDNTVIEPIEFKVSALGNCGELQEKKFLYHLPLEGLEQIQMVGVTAASSSFTAIQSGGIAEGQITVTITNNSLEPMDNLIVGIDLPDGISVTTTSGSSSILGFSLQTIEMSNDALNVRLISPSDYSIPAGESRTFTISVQENKNCPQLLSEASIYAEIPVDVASECGTNTCRVRARTERVSVELNRLRQPVVITIAGADIVCVGNEVTLTASGADSYQWNTGSTNATTEVTYPTSTYHVIGTTSDGCSGEAEHTITFVERLTQPQLALVVGSDTVTNGKIQYSDWNTMGEQIIHPISDVEGTLTKISEPNDGKCGTYEYQYTIANQCDSLTASITFEVENCDTTTCEDGDLVVIDGKPGYTLEDLDVLRGYVQNGATLQPTSDGGFTIAIQSNCGETTYTLNSCFINNADINKDGV
ncbi:MAG: hypothetical protein MJ198_06180, partial [Bacteroidales bacterium]|nr:hypothetical protein [Bacteroidales bacterium]